MEHIKFNGETLRLEYGQYFNSRPAITLINKQQEPYLTATVNLPDADIDNEHVAIKSYSENEGMLEVLISNNIVSKPIRYDRSGFVLIPICKLLK